jgi:hypothetical protein
MKLIEGHNWVYTIHILVVAPLLLYISIGYLFNKKMNEDLYKFAMYALLGFSVLMVIYHASKLNYIPLNVCIFLAAIYIVYNVY